MNRIVMVTVAVCSSSAAPAKPVPNDDCVAHVDRTIATTTTIGDRNQAIEACRLLAARGPHDDCPELVDKFIGSAETVSDRNQAIAKCRAEILKDPVAFASDPDVICARAAIDHRRHQEMHGRHPGEASKGEEDRG